MTAVTLIEKNPTVKANQAFTISSHSLDIILGKALDADLENTIELPSRLQVNVNYGRELAAWYREKDIVWIEENFLKTLSPVELSVLDALTRWTYRNTGDLMRSAVGLVGAALFRNAIVPGRDHPITGTEIGKDIYNNLIAEPIWTIRRLFQTATTAGSIDAKIPLNNMALEFGQLSQAATEDKETPNIPERERQARLMEFIQPSTPLREDSMERDEFAAARLIQMTKAVARYKRDDGFGRLRSFLTNGSMFASMVRVKSHDDLGLSRLCSDVLDIFHSIDRLLNSNCVAANGIVERMERGELLYDEILAMGRHQHRIMAVEFTGALTMFAYLLKQADIDLYDDKDVRSAANRLIGFSGVSEQYGNEVVSKQMRAN